MSKENKVLPAGVTEYNVTVIGMRTVHNENGGYVEFKGVDRDQVKSVIQTFFLAERSIRNSLNSLAIWTNALVRNQEGDEQIKAPDFTALQDIADLDGIEFNKEKAIAEFIKSCIEEINSIKGQVRPVHQAINEGFDTNNVKRTYRNWYPYAYGSRRNDSEVDTNDSKPTGVVAGYLG